jgi:tetratricopeptide (TPR) repeat protein
MDIALVGLIATAVAFRIMFMTTGRRANEPLNKKKFLLHIGIMALLLGYCLLGALLRTRSDSAPDPRQQLTLVRAKSEALRAAGQTAEARHLSMEALALAERTYGKDDVRITPLLDVHAANLAAQGNFGEAEKLRQRALAIAIRHFGEDHPDVALQENNLGTLYVEMGRLEPAESLYRKALSKTERFVGQIPPALPAVLENLATLCERTGRAEEAGRLRERAKGYRPGR